MCTSDVRPTARMSIVMGTLNRCEMLERSIGSLLEQGIAKDRFEVIVVDNGCTDQTEAIMRGICQHSSNVRYVKEPTLGLSNARNKGIAEARYELVGFFDDDATAEPGWMQLLLEAFDGDAGIGAAGGPIFVGWPTSRPEWMPQAYEGYYGHCYYGREPIELRFPQYPFGSNMVIRRELLLAINGFRDNVGPKGQNMMSAGEQDLFMRLYQLPIRVMYQPGAVVYHWVQGERVTKEWLTRRAFKHGFSNTKMLSNSDGLGRGALLSRLVKSCSRAVAGRVSSAAGKLGRQSPAIIMSRKANSMYWAGVAKGTFESLLSSCTSNTPSNSSITTARP